jgi:hypothetical protein
MRVIVVFVLSSLCVGCVSGPYIAGNDTGGLIDWSPATELVAEGIAWDHCSRFGRAAYVTRVNRRAGDYIQFRCLTYAVDRVTPPLAPAVADGRGPAELK